MTFVKTMLILGGILIFLLNFVLADGPTFYGNMTLHIESEPEGVALGDLQGDGGTDMVIVGESGQVYISYSRHDGTFTETREIYSADSIAYIYDVGMGDINGDGLGDILFSWEDDNSGDEFLTIIPNAGYPNFGEPSHYLLNNSAYDIEVFDVDGDTDNDIAVTSTADIGVFINDGSGTFGARTDHNFGISWAYEMAVGDYDDDDDIDLAVACYNNSSLKIMTNDGSGAFTVTQTYGTDGYGNDIISVDFDNNDTLDLVLVERSNFKVMVYMGNGDGTFADSVNYHTGLNIRSVSAADMDGDNDLDLVVGIWADLNGLCILENDGFNVFGAPQVHGIPYCVKTYPGDFDSDGDMDIVSRGNDNEVFILYNNGVGEFPGPDKYEAGTQTNDLVVADFDGDLDDDIIAACGYTDDIVVFLNNDADSTLAAGVSYNVGSRPYAIDAADFDQDTDIDIVVTTEEADSVAVLFNNGDGTFGTPTYYYAGDQPRFISAVNFNADAYPDFVVGAWWGQSFRVYVNGGDKTFTESSYNTEIARIKDVKAVDLDGDTYIDIAVLLDRYPTYIQRYYNDGTSNFTEGDSILTVYYAESMHFVDIDEDNDIDLITGANYDYISMQLNDGNGNYADTVVYSMEGGPHSVAVGDIDLDGDLDIAASPEYASYITVWGTDGSGVLENPMAYDGGYEYVYTCDLADMNDDGYLDLIAATRRWSTGTDSIMIFWNTQQLISADADDDNGNIDNIPDMFSLAQNYPNPFNPITTINFTLDKKMEVTLKVYNLLGQEVTTLVNDTKPAGSYDIFWNGRDARDQQVASGIYFYQLRTKDQSLAKKMLLLK